eukprot:1843682-Alexandrium_andersonii.AAC.1
MMQGWFRLRMMLNSRSLMHWPSMPKSMRWSFSTHSMPPVPTDHDGSNFYIDYLLPLVVGGYATC